MVARGIAKPQHSKVGHLSRQPASLRFAHIQKELGAAIATNKTVIPVIWDITPSELPGWISQYQALNIASKSVTEVQADVSAIAKRIRAKKTDGLALIGLIIAGLVAAKSK